MRLSIVNANTSAHVTEMMVAAARALPIPDLAVRGATPAMGPAIIGTRFENDLAARGLIELAVEEAASADAILLGVSYDTGLRALRELLDIPVIGMTESALLAARTLGDRIGLVGIGPRTEPLYRDTVAAAGFAPLVAAWRFVDLPAAFLAGERSAVFVEIARAAGDLAAVERLDAVVVLGAVMAGATAALQGRTPVPVLDGLTTGVLMADLRARLGPMRATTGAFAPPSGRVVTGISERLERLARDGRV